VLPSSPYGHTRPAALQAARYDANPTRADNIDYDDIKFYIKEQTTPGKGKSISIPGQSDEKLQQFENSLFGILRDQHERIDLFVRSKAGEIRRRLGKLIRSTDDEPSF
jgi:hypothetical protein